MTDTAEAPITHPEEMRAGFDLKIGKNINLRGSGRLTPPGVVTAGFMTVGVLLAEAVLVRAALTLACARSPGLPSRDAQILRALLAPVRDDFKRHLEPSATL
jgi:hypothetical protein